MHYPFLVIKVLRRKSKSHSSFCQFGEYLGLACSGHSINAISVSLYMHADLNSILYKLLTPFLQFCFLKLEPLGCPQHPDCDLSPPPPPVPSIIRLSRPLRCNSCLVSLPDEDREGSSSFLVAKSRLHREQMRHRAALRLVVAPHRPGDSPSLSPVLNFQIFYQNLGPDLVVRVPSAQGGPHPRTLLLESSRPRFCFPPGAPDSVDYSPGPETPGRSRWIR